MPIQDIDIVAFDLDGTLLNDEKKASPFDLQTLEQLERLKILRVVATGRNYYSLLKVLPFDFPADYVVFSSGAGIMDWKSKQILYTRMLEKSELKLAVDILIQYQLNFSVHLAIPNNHHILLHAPHPKADDLVNYTNFYKDFVTPFNPNKIPKQATQLIVLLNHHVNLFDELQTKMDFAKTILTTSPINHQSMWMEIFHRSVSKANGLVWLCHHLKMEHPVTMGIGNDFNDIDLLNHADISFVVSNAPKELKEKHPSVKSNNESGFTDAVTSIIKF
ncbi:MAG: HAD hydrolase family protein [Salinivirgaceae bacterium]